MKTEICKDCLYSAIGINNRRICTKKINTETRSVKECPMGYSEEDIEWIEKKAKEDSARGHILYTHNSTTTTAADNSCFNYF